MSNALLKHIISCKKILDDNLFSTKYYPIEEDGTFDHRDYDFPWQYASNIAKIAFDNLCDYFVSSNLEDADIIRLLDNYLVDYIKSEFGSAHLFGLDDYKNPDQEKIAIEILTDVEDSMNSQIRNLRRSYEKLSAIKSNSPSQPVDVESESTAVEDMEPNQDIKAARHLVAFLHKLGILEFLRGKYDNNVTDGTIAKLVMQITGLKNLETTRADVRDLRNKPEEIFTVPVETKVRSLFAEHRLSYEE